MGKHKRALYRLLDEISDCEWCPVKDEPALCELVAANGKCTETIMAAYVARMGKKEGDRT